MVRAALGNRDGPAPVSQSTIAARVTDDVRTSGAVRAFGASPWPPMPRSGRRRDAGPGPGYGKSGAGQSFGVNAVIGCGESKVFITHQPKEGRHCQCREAIKVGFSHNKPNLDRHAPLAMTIYAMMHWIWLISLEFSYRRRVEKVAIAQKTLQYIMFFRRSEPET